MSKTCKRVPLDFSATIGETYEGFINPNTESEPCTECKGTGQSVDYNRLLSLWYSHLEGGFKPDMTGSTPIQPDDPYILGLMLKKVNRSEDSKQYYGTSFISVLAEANRMCAIWNSSWSNHLHQRDVDALVAAGRLMDFTHVWTAESGWVEKSPAYHPTAEEVNRWSLSGISHDSCNCWEVLKAELARLGLPSECHHCGGAGEIWSSEQAKTAYEAWQPSEPPLGDGYQLWDDETPSSPVFASMEELSEYCAAFKSTFGNFTASAAEWKAMLEEGFVAHREGNTIFTS